MSKSSYFITARAELDLTEIMVYIATRNPDAAVSLIERFYRVFELLAENPKAGRERPELGAGLRSMPEGRYLILFRSWSGHVSITRVVHSARDLDEIFS